MFYFLEDFDIANYADDSVPYCAGRSTEFVVNNLQLLSTIFPEWLNSNYMEINTVKAIYYFQAILELQLPLAIATLNQMVNRYYLV